MPFTIWLALWEGAGLGSLFVFCARSVEPGTPALHHFWSISCLHWGNAVSVVVLAVFSRGGSNLAGISDFSIYQNSGKLGSLWIEISLLYKDQLLIAAAFGTVLFPSYLFLSFFCYVGMILYDHSSVPWLYECMHNLTYQFKICFSGASVLCNLYTNIWRKKVQLLQDLETLIN